MYLDVISTNMLDNLGFCRGNVITGSSTQNQLFCVKMKSQNATSRCVRNPHFLTPFYTYDAIVYYALFSLIKEILLCDITLDDPKKEATVTPSSDETRNPHVFKIETNSLIYFVGEDPTWQAGVRLVLLLPARHVDLV